MSHKRDVLLLERDTLFRRTTAMPVVLNQIGKYLFSNPIIFGIPLSGLFEKVIKLVPIPVPAHVLVPSYNHSICVDYKNIR